MTAPSIKEALELKPCPFCNTAPAFGRMIEPDQVTIGCNNDGCLVQLCVVSDVESEAVKAWNTRATLQPSGERREAIALALAEKWPGDYMHGDDECERAPNALAYEVADVALSSVGLSSAICALEESRSLVEWLLEGRELDDMDQIRIGKWSAACQKADALATLQPDGERREAIAQRLACAHSAHALTAYRAGAGPAVEYWNKLADAALASGFVQDEAGWRDISTAPKDALKVTSEMLLLAHFEKKWIRFGKWYVQEGCWYYSGTNERSQYAQVRGDDPTHWMPLPAIRSARDGGAES